MAVCWNHPLLPCEVRLYNVTDMVTTPVTGLHTQLCGDAHLLNVGIFAMPEHKLVFDINDLDETDPGPWEWDLK